MNIIAALTKQTEKKVVKKRFKHIDLYMMSIPGIVFLILFKYAPIYGVIIAFKDYNIIQGILNSKWIGFDNFKMLFSFDEFPKVIRNTVVISFMKLIVGFPAPILLAILLNEMRNVFFKRTIQTITYIPHFISWVVISGIFIDLLSPSTGIINTIIHFFGVEPIFFMAEHTWIRWVLVVSDMWKEIGWGAIIYLAAMMGINSELYQAATVDGASRFRQIWHVTLPSIRSTIIVILLIRIGYIMDAGMEQVLMMYNAAVYEVADIIDTYVYRVAFGSLDFSMTAAAGLFKSLIGCILLIVANWITRIMGEDGIY